VTRRLRNVLFVCHRFPYPPDRGEKIRIWHVLRHLAQSHRVFLGCLTDDARDRQYIPHVAAICADMGCFPIDKRRQKLRALARARPGRPLMLDYYDHAPLRRWIADIVARETIDFAYVISTAMAPYVRDLAVPKILDMVDVDSEKWADYATRSRFPTRLVWGREARTLRNYEREAARDAARTLLVTALESEHFARAVPDISGRVLPLENGVDLDYFDPSAARFAAPYPGASTADGPWVTMVGNLDYWPNEDAANWMATTVLPRLRQRRTPPAKLAIVGANPGRAVLELGKLPGVLVTGRVDDVRPYLVHADVVVAPLHIARGVQNKVLEGMAMARPVVATPQAFRGIRAEPGRDLLVADGEDALANAIIAVLDGQHPEMGAAARNAVEAGYAWSRQMARLDAILAEILPP